MAVFLFLFFLLSPFAAASQGAPTGALHLMTYQTSGYTVDSSLQGQRVKRILADAVRLGFRRVVLNFRGHMITGTGSDIRFLFTERERQLEDAMTLETVAYAKSLGLSVFFRPILLVVGPKGEFPYEQAGKTWWHGNIEPKDPARWFESYFLFHKRYLELAAKAGAEWYSIGAEMNSMTSGLGEQNRNRELGYPEKWVELLRKARSILGNATRISYGVNYTDQVVREKGQKIQGGELEQWRFYLVENFTEPRLVRHQQGMRALWASLDSIGLDYYRALATPRSSYPLQLRPLSDLLLERAGSHATQLNNTLTEISMTVGTEKEIFFEEVGYRSATESFLRPATYERKPGIYNPLHQAAAWDAFFRAYWEPGWKWMSGVAMWQVLVDEEPVGAGNTGFSPLGKTMTEEVLMKHLRP